MATTGRPEKVILGTAALRRLGALGALTAAVMITAPAALGQPSPDAAPVAPTIAPDPAPAAPTAPAEPPPAAVTPTESAPAQPAPAEPAPPTPVDDPPATADRRPAQNDRPAPKARRAERKTTEADRALPRPVATPAFLRLETLVPAETDTADPSSTPMLLAAGALLMLVLASGSFVSVLARLMPPTAVLLVMLAAAVPAHAGTITPNCDAAGARDGCSRWYTAPKVSLSWSIDPGGELVSGCQVSAFTLETAPIYRECRWDWSGSVFTARVWVGIDRTAPQVTGLQPARPPDYNDWFNHPVGLQFKGTDALSGVQSCTGTTYSGPDGAGALVGGTCRDVAGNTGAASLALNYDATPPASPRVEVAPGDRRVAVKWSGSDQAEITRLHGGEAVVIYRGGGGAHTDTGLKNEERYRYVVTLIDQAGNRASSETVAVPTASPLITPSANVKLSAPPLLTWRKVRRASYYNVQLHRRNRKILSRWPRTNELQLTRRWRFAGKPRRLVAGRYCWYVWPGFGPRSRRDYGRVLGKRCFTVTR
jgi:hypothetical protein